MGEQVKARENDPADKADAEDDKKQQSAEDSGGTGADTPKEKPEPDDDAKEKAAEMMEAYKERPTLVLPGSGKTITGTAVNDWLDDEGNPKYADDEDSPAKKARNESGGDDQSSRDDGKKSDTGAKAKDDDSDGEGRDREGGAHYQSERGEAADQTAELHGKSPEEIQEDADKKADENIEKDKEYNKALMDEAKEMGKYQDDEDEGDGNAQPKSAEPKSAEPTSAEPTSEAKDDDKDDSGGKAKDEKQEKAASSS